MKLYIHHEGAEPFTCIYRSDDPKADVSSLSQHFAKAYNDSAGRRGAPQIAATSLVVSSSKGRTIETSKRISKAFKDMDDVFVKFVEPSGSAGKVSTSSAVPGDKVEKPSTTSSSKSGSASTRSRAPGPESASGWPVVKTLIARGEELEKESKFRTAVATYEQVFAVASGEKYALLHLLRLWLKVGRPLVGKQWCEPALKHHPDDPDVLLAVGDIRRACGDCHAALEIYNRAADAASKSKAKEPDIKDIKLGAARAMYQLGGDYQQMAAKLVMEILEPDNSHLGGLLEYAKIAFDRGLIPDATQVLLRVIVKKESDEEAKKYLAMCLEEESGFQALMSELEERQGVESAYAFLSGKVKDRGAIGASLKLYKKAMQVEPTNSSFALDYVHLLELSQDFKGVVEFAQAFCSRCRETLGRDLELREIVRGVDGVGALYSDTPLAFYGKEPWDPLDAAKSEAKDGVEEIVQQVEFSSPQLDLMALIFTLMKVLFVGGALDRVSKLVNAIELARKASQKELHTTLIRNEAAYFGCISQIIWEHPPPAVTPGQDVNPLFLCGDSHCLSGAWRHVCLRGENRLLVPQLITGCKVWHLRDEGDFYPKKSFESHIKKLPDRAQVIMMFGEIDCRDGIMLAVEKCKYDSEAEAIETTVDIYIKLLLRLIRERHFEIFIHPISPVLDVTRPVVKSYMSCLKRKALDAIQEHSLQGKLHWLDFFEKLLSADGTRLNPEIEFDGTHMSPAYVQWLNDALTKIA
ncbi:hypothetical protein BSKO_01770 [Bryopsis sp. KO-2023]|nr:hypothetical protein BSKO_01770 [Bryopsis sp. KO-2023]